MAALAGLATSGHVLYPAWLALGPAARRKSPAIPADPASWPSVSVVIPAYREAGVISEKVRLLNGLGYPGPMEILVVADGDPATAEAAVSAGARALAPADRLGKPAAMNLGMSQVESDIVVFTDANNRISPGSIEAMVRWFADPTVGAVAGEKTEVGAAGESLYWRFESWLKRREARLGTTLGVVGELMAVRRKAFCPIAEEVAVDDLWMAMDLVKRGWRIVYEPSASSIEESAESLGVSWQRRTRIAAGAIHVLIQRRDQLVIGKRPEAVQLWGHRLARYTVGPLSHLALLMWALARIRSSRSAAAFVGGHLVAASCLAADEAGWAVPGALRAASHVLYLQAVAVGGMIRYLKKDRYTKWQTVRR